MSDKTGLRRHISFIVRITVSTVLLSTIIYIVGPQKLWDTVKEADLRLVMLFFPILFLVGIAGAWRWQILLACQEIRISLWTSFKLTILGFFSNNFLPGLTGGDLVKAIYVTGATEYKTRAILSVLVDRIIGMVSMGIISLIVVIAWADREIVHKAAPIIVALLAACALSTVFFLGGRKWGMDRLAKRFPFWGISDEFVKASDFYGNSKGTLLAALILSFACHFMIMTLYWGYGKSLGIKGVGFADYMFVVPMISFVAALPVSIMGWGTGEITCSWLLETKGVSRNLGVALSAMVRASIVICSLPGGLVAATYKRKNEVPMGQDEQPACGHKA